MSVMDKIVLYGAGTMDLCFLVGYLLSGQPGHQYGGGKSAPGVSHLDLIAGLQVQRTRHLISPDTN